MQAAAENNLKGGLVDTVISLDFQSVISLLWVGISLFCYKRKLNTYNLIGIQKKLLLYIESLARTKIELKV